MGDMNLQHRIVTWNCNGRAAAWDYLLDLHPDVALLQEVGPIPEQVKKVYDTRLAAPRTKTGKPQRFFLVTGLPLSLLFYRLEGIECQLVVVAVEYQLTMVVRHRIPYHEMRMKK
jgi:hypothetical protein